jgi:hypothetical protein
VRNERWGVVCFMFWLVDCERFVALGKRRDSIIFAYRAYTLAISTVDIDGSGKRRAGGGKMHIIDRKNNPRFLEMLPVSDRPLRLIGFITSTILDFRRVILLPYGADWCKKLGNLHRSVFFNRMPD